MGWVGSSSGGGYNLFDMIVPLKLKHKTTGEETTFYSHTSFIDKAKWKEVEDLIDSRLSFRNKSAIVVGLFTTVLTFKPSVCARIPKAIPVWSLGLITATATLFLTHFLTVRPIGNQVNSILEDQTIPLYDKRENVPNLDRLFFELSDDFRQMPSILHSGISADTIRDLAPTQVFGPAPKAPEGPKIHHHH